MFIVVSRWGSLYLNFIRRGNIQKLDNGWKSQLTPLPHPPLHLNNERSLKMFRCVTGMQLIKLCVYTCMAKV